MKKRITVHTRITTSKLWKPEGRLCIEMRRIAVRGGASIFSPFPIWLPDRLTAAVVKEADERINQYYRDRA